MIIDAEKWCKRFKQSGITTHQWTRGNGVAFGQNKFLILSDTDGTFTFYPDDINDDEIEAARPLLHDLMEEYLKPEPRYYWRLKIIDDVDNAYLNTTPVGIYFLSANNVNDYKTQFTRAEFEELIPECMWDLFEAEGVEI